jgi:hypothetical protein
VYIGVCGVDADRGQIGSITKIQETRNNEHTTLTASWQMQKGSGNRVLVAKELTSARI